MLPISSDEIFDLIGSMWVELLFVIALAITFGLRQIVQRKMPQDRASHVFAKVHAESASGKSVAVVAAWQKVQRQHLTPPDTLRIVAQALMDAQPHSLAEDIVEHLSFHIQEQNVTKAAVAALEVVAKAGNVTVLDDLQQKFSRRLHMPPTAQMQEVLLGGYATAGDECKVQCLVGQLRRSRQKVTVRGYSLMIRGFLKNGMLDASLKQIDDMSSQKMNMPSFAVPELFRVARASERAAEVFSIIANKQFVLTTSVISSMLEDCLKHNDLQLAKEIYDFSGQTKTQLNFPAYEALLKLHASVGDLHAMQLFDEAQRMFQISEGFVVSLLVRCAESRFLQFAEKLVSYLRSRGRVSIVVYSALMKVYSFCNMPEEACNLYEQLTAEGLEPDSVMYGSLMRLSAECGRTNLTRELSTKVPGSKLGSHHQLSLIRAAAQDKDLGKALAVLDGLREAGTLDTLTCNAVLDACCTLGNMDSATKLTTDMKLRGLMDIVSYNTLLKGYCMLNDAERVRGVLTDMEANGCHPNDVSYNCLINVAASAGDICAAWKTIETMERKHVRIDHYTLSTLMKALKKAPNGKHFISQVLDLLDRHQIDICREEVLLNTALEACMKHGEHRRLASLFDTMNSRRGIQLAPHTYANLIKASSTLKCLTKCRELWTEMTSARGIEPTGVALGCMLDALVCNGCVAEAVALLRQWQERVPVNTVIYSTLIKGFLNARDTKGAVGMWNELRSKKLEMNVMVYNAIIDVHARSGATKEISQLLELMEKDGVQGDDVTKSLVAKSYCMKGELDKAVDVFHSLSSEPNANTVIVFNTILDGCVRHNRTELADDLLAKMDAYRISPSNFTLGIIVKMWGRRGHIAKALAAVKTMPKQYGFTPNGPVRTCLFFACLRNDAIDSALEVFEDLRAARHPLDTKIYSALINTCTKVGRYEQAISLVVDAYGLSDGAKRTLPHGEQLEAQCLEHLIKCLTKQGQLQKHGIPLVKKMLQVGVPTSSRLMALSVNNQN